MTNHITLSDFPASCSCMKLTSKQGRPYWFRTCDLNTSIWDAGAHAVSFPADYAITAANGTLRTRYALLGMSYCTVDSWLLDGVNSEGLVGGLLLLEEGTSVTAAEAGSSGVMGMELVTALLATCRNVTEVCQAAKDIRITDIPAETGFLPATMHYFFLDAAGNTVVLEAADPTQPGRLTCYREDSIGVISAFSKRFFPIPGSWTTCVGFSPSRRSCTMAAMIVPSASLHGRAFGWQRIPTRST